MISCLHLYVTVSNGNDVRDGIPVHHLLRLQEGSHLPLRVLVGELLFIPGTSTDDDDV